MNVLFTESIYFLLSQTNVDMNNMSIAVIVMLAMQSDISFATCVV